MDLCEMGRTSGQSVAVPSGRIDEKRTIVGRTERVLCIVLALVLVLVVGGGSGASGPIDSVVLTASRPTLTSGMSTLLLANTYLLWGLLFISMVSSLFLA